MKEQRAWPLLAAGAALLLVGAGTAFSKIADEPLSWALGASGLVCLGVWLATEIVDFTLSRFERQKRPDELDNSDEL